MATIDDKVVAMSFESSKFEQGVNSSISSIEKLKAALKFDGATQGLNAIDQAAQTNHFGLLGSAVDDVSSKLNALRLVGIGVLTNLANVAISAGSQFVKSFTVGPIVAGLQEYATNLNAIQTILANTQAAGTNLNDVNKSLNELNHYSDKTIYNFTQMARNIGTFTAAGVDLKTSTEAIKGIANLAALSGSNADQASTAMYQLSQAIAAGQVHLQDWNSVVNAGMGGTVFQRALAQTAVAMGTIDGKTVKLTGKMKNVSIAGNSFRQSLTPKPGEKSWLTSKVLTTTLSEFTGDLSNAQLHAKGFNDEQIKAIQQTAKTAEAAATQVKTLPQLLDTVREAIGSGWTETWTLVFGNFTQAKKLFTGLSNALNAMVQANAKARNKILKDWQKLGGRDALIKGLVNAFHDLQAVVKPVTDAFHDIFPPLTGKRLADLSKKFEEFTKALVPSQKTIDDLRRTFRGVFAVLDIGKQILGGFFDVFKRVMGIIAGGSGSFLQITGGIGDFLVKVDEALKKGKGLDNFFNGLGDILVVPFKMIGKLRDAIAGLFDQGSTGKQSAVAIVVGKIGTAFGNLLESFSHTDKFFDHVFKAFGQFAHALGPAIATAFKNINFSAILQVIQTGLFAGLVLLFKNFFGQGSFIQQITGQGAGGFIQGLLSPFTQLRNSLFAMQTEIKARAIKEIAISVALLAGSVVALSFVDPRRLSASLGAMTVAFGELLGGMGILTAVTKTAGFIKLPVIASSLILLAGAILILSASVVILAQLDWDKLLRGLTGVGVLLGIISVAAIPLSKNSAGMIRAGIGITAMSVGLVILAEAVKIFATMSWGEMAKGLVGVGVGLGILVGAMMLMPTGGMLGTSVGLIAVSGALILLASAVKKFGNMDWSIMGKGILGIAGALVLIGVAMHLMPPNMILIGAGLIVVSLALEKIQGVISKFGGMSITQIAKGLGVLAGALIILGAALFAMEGNLAGAAALIIVAESISVLAGALQSFGSMSWMQILKSMLTLAGVLTIIGIAGALITPAIPSLLGLGAAMLLIGAGLALIGVGVALIATGFSALVVALPTGVGIIVAAFTQLIKGLIDNIKLLVLGALEIADAFAKTAPKFVAALVVILSALIDGLIKITPKVEELIQTLIDAMIKLLHDNEDNIIQAAADLFLSLLKGIRDNMDQMTKVANDIIVKFLDGLDVTRIVTAGMNVIVKFINGIANNIKDVVRAGGRIIVKIIEGIGNNYEDIIKAGGKAVAKFITGVENAAEDIVKAGVKAAGKFMNAVAGEIPKLADKMFNAIIKMLNGLSRVIKQREPELIAATAGIGAAIIEGLVVAIGNGKDKITNALLDLLPAGVRQAAEAAMGVTSAVSKVSSAASHVAHNATNILTHHTSLLNQSSSALDHAANSVNKVASKTSLNLNIDSNPTITPVLDLTQVRSQAGELSKLTTTSPITVTASLKHASSISPIGPDGHATTALGGSAVHFEQTINSPKTLSEVEIYRHTKNQLSQLKTALALN